MTMMTGILVKAIAGFYYAKAGDRIYECKARGIMKKEGISPLPGDHVEFQAVDEKHGIIERVLERRNFFNRPTVANVDKLFIVSSYVKPVPNTYLIDTMSVIAADKDIEPIIVFNKCDMGDFSQFEKIYRRAGLKVYTVSALTGEGISGLEAETKGNVSVFTGNSGVGKSSLLNVLFPELRLATGEISEKLGRGRHTTREVQLFAHGNDGYVVDTPGFSALDIKSGEKCLKENLQFDFMEFEPYIGKCRFNTCSHTVEDGCAVLEAVKSGEIGQSRFASYCMMYAELKNDEVNRYKG